MSGKWILVFRKGILRFLNGKWGILCVSMALEPVAALCIFAGPGQFPLGGAVPHVVLVLLGTSQVPAMVVAGFLFHPFLPSRTGSALASLYFLAFLAIGFCTIFAVLALVRFLVRALWHFASRAMRAHR